MKPSSEQRIIDLPGSEAKEFFLRPTSYFGTVLPPYINPAPLLSEMDDLLAGRLLSDFYNGKDRPYKHDDVNYTIISNKDGQYAWRPLQLIHPAIYVDIVNKITEPENWKKIKLKLNIFQKDKRILCASDIVESNRQDTDQPTTILHWWRDLEQASIRLALQYRYVMHTDITNCYGSIYTHSIAWAICEKNMQRNTAMRIISATISMEE